jgi:CDP-diacylglycerol--serine O-phosphatidyltransferase
MDVDVTEKIRHRGIYLLPNLFTAAGLFAGFYAIVAAFKGQFEHAAYAIFIAMVMDAVDGRVARMTNTQTLFGTEFDSLADIVSFGVAPAVVFYSWALIHMGKLGWLAAFFYTAMGALRLARFNTQVSSADKRYFQGLSITAAAGVMAGVASVFGDGPVQHWFWLVLILLITVALGLLMISNIRYSSFKQFNFRHKVPFIAVFAAVVIFVFIALDPGTVLLLLFTGYAISGPSITLYTIGKKRRIRSKLRKRRKDVS